MKTLRFHARTLSAAFLVFFVACGDSSGSSEGTRGPGPEPLALLEATPAFDIGAAVFYEGIPYGPFDENLFDIYLPESEEPTPLLLYIHGGGFTGGSRDTSNREAQVMAYLESRVAYASIDYRLLQSPDPDGVIKPLMDSTRALQFIRYHHEQLNVDPENVILMGGSAGAGTSLWIGFNDDMADPESGDPVLRESTRVTAVIAIATQATYDIGKWATVVFEEFNVDLLALADALGLAQSLLDFYGITDVETFESDDILDYRARVDMLDLMDADDPPMYVQNDLEPADVAPLTVNLAFHHANHAVSLMDRAEEVGLEAVVNIGGLMLVDPSGEDSTDFALRHFGL